ncbi:MAG: hypothetical protein CML57_03765 [Rhodobacteraceae bacterium]|nr:hypothetical protein [Paracoccaceae bacterium]
MRAELDQRLAADSIHVAWLEPDIEVRLMDDQRFVWVLLIPLGADYVEPHDLPDITFRKLFDHARSLSAKLKQQTAADKINMAVLGNHVSQLHLHLIMRHAKDVAWPEPVWGKGQPIKMGDEDIIAARKLVQTALN